MSQALHYTVHIYILVDNQLPRTAFKYQYYAFYTECVWVYQRRFPYQAFCQQLGLF